MDWLFFVFRCYHVLISQVLSKIREIQTKICFFFLGFRRFLFGFIRFWIFLVDNQNKNCFLLRFHWFFCFVLISYSRHLDPIYIEVDPAFYQEVFLLLYDKGNYWIFKISRSWLDSNWFWKFFLETCIVRSEIGT
jgi:hypothetical protein